MTSRIKLALLVGLAIGGAALPAFAQSDLGATKQHWVAPRNGQVVVRHPSGQGQIAGSRSRFYDVSPGGQTDSNIPYYGNAPYDQRDDW